MGVQTKEENKNVLYIYSIDQGMKYDVVMDNNQTKKEGTKMVF